MHEQVQASRFPEDVRRSCRRCRRPLHLDQGCERAVEQYAGKGREAAGAALEALRAGRRGPVPGQRQEIQRQVRRRGARRRRRLGGRAAQGGGRREHRRRPGHHPVDQRRRQPLSGKAARRHRRLHVPRREVRRLVSGVRPLPAARWQEVDRRPARRGGRLHGVPREPHEGGGLRQRSRRTPTASSSCARRSRTRARRRDSRSATRPATATPGATGCCGPSAASSSTRTTRS